MKIILKTDDLNYIFKALKPALAKTEHRPVLTRIHLKCDSGKCEATAVDGYRLHTVTVPCEGDNGEVLIPIIKIPKNNIPKVIISDTDDNITFDFNTEKQICNKMVGEFFNWKTLVPEGEPEYEISFNPKFIEDACKTYSGLKVITFKFYGKTKPCIIEQNEFDKRLVMPIRK